LASTASPPRSIFPRDTIALERVEVKPHGIIREAKARREIVDRPRPFPQERENAGPRRVGPPSGRWSFPVSHLPQF
jgi:hypothetical protein